MKNHEKIDVLKVESSKGVYKCVYKTYLPQIFSSIKHRFSHIFRSIRFHPMTPTCPSHRQGHGHYRAVSRHGPHGHQNQVSDGVQKRRQKSGKLRPEETQLLGGLLGPRFFGV